MKKDIRFLKKFGVLPDSNNILLKILKISNEIRALYIKKQKMF